MRRLRFLIVIFMLSASTAQADLNACFAARDRACVVQALPALVAAAITEDPRRARHELPKAARDAREDVLKPVLEGFIAAPRDEEDWLLLKYHARLRDPKGLKRYASAIGQASQADDWLAFMGMKAAFAGEFELATQYAARPETEFLLLQRDARSGRWGQAFERARKLHPEALSAAVQRLAWHAVKSGDERRMRRVAEALLTLTQEAPPRARPSIWEWMAAITSDDPDDFAMVAEWASLPELSDDPVYKSVHEIIAAIVLHHLRTPDEALLSKALQRLRHEMQTFDAEIDDVLIALALGARRLGAADIGDQIFALRDKGAFTFHSFLLERLGADAPHFLPIAARQLWRMIDLAHETKRYPRYLARHLTGESLVDEVGAICRAWRRIGRSDRALAVFEAATERLARSGAAPGGFLVRACYPEAHPAFADSFKISPDTYREIEWALAHGSGERLAALVEAEQYINVSHLVGALQEVDQDRARAVAPLLWPILLRFEQSLRAKYPEQADDVAAHVFTSKLLLGLDSSGQDYQRIQTALYRGVAAIWAAQAFAGDRLAFGPEEAEPTPVWYYSKAALVPGFYE